MDFESVDLDIDFAELARSDGDFDKLYKSAGGQLDFQDSQTVKQLTKSILQSKFNIQIELPDDRLCPPVHIRYAYIRWLQQLIDTTSSSYSDVYKPERCVVGLDIGVGASCIYPLLGCAVRGHWNFLGTEIDEKNFQYANHNVELNGLGSRIQLIKKDLSDPLITDHLGIKSIDFVMCNPPFFDSLQDMAATHINKRQAPSAVCTGAECEMITQGGDIGFALRILEESQMLRERVQWYSSMLGKLSSVYSLVEKLKELQITNWAVTTLLAGNVTRRWVVAWSFQDLRPANEVARCANTAKEILPFPTEYILRVPNLDKEDLQRKINENMNKLEIKWSWTNETASGTLFAQGNAWSRSARRARKRQNDHKDDVSTPAEKPNFNIEDAALGLRIKLEGSHDMDLADKIIVRWLKGFDSVLFESFCGWLKRALNA